MRAYKSFNNIKFLSSSEVKAIGNSGYVRVPKKFVGKTAFVVIEGEE